MTRAELADEIARAAIYRAQHDGITFRDHGHGVAYWVQGRLQQWLELVAYAGGFLAARQQAPR